MHIKNFRACYLITGIATTATWDDSGFLHFSLLIAAALLILAQYQIPESRLFAPVTRFPQGVSTGKEWFEIFMVSCIILAPYAFILVTSWTQEYPFLTDHTHHVMATIAANNFWLEHLPILLMVFPGIYIAEKSGGWKWWIILALVLFLLFGARNGIPSFFSRYPALGYFMALPFNFLAHIMEWPTLLNVNRSSHIFSIALWLFLFRPLIIKKWPDLSILPFAICIFFQKDLAYYFSSVFLEPWALIFLILALEYAYRNPNSPEFALYLVGAASLVKEQAIFCFPFFLLLLRPWKLSMRELARMALIAIIVIFPFAMYFQKRSAMQTWRHSTLGDFASIFSYERVDTYWHRLRAQFGDEGLFLLIVTGFFMVLLLVFSGKYRLMFLSFVAAGFFQIIYFFSDQISLSFTGYSRFSLVTLVFFASPMLQIGSYLQTHRLKIILILATIFIACFQVPTFGPFLHSYVQSSVSRNFFEHYDGPYHFPIRKIIEESERRGDLSPAQPVEILFPLPTDRKSIEFIFPMAYPNLHSRFKIMPNISSEKPNCTCDLKNGAKIVLFVHYANLANNIPSAIVQDRDAKTCEKNMKKSCQNLRTEIAEGSVLAMIGISAKQTPLD